jgi:hypothetical protein
MALSSSAEGFGQQMRDMVRGMDENETSGLEDFEALGLEFKRRIGEYAALRNNNSDAGPPFDFDIPFDIEELVNQSRRGSQ